MKHLTSDFIALRDRDEVNAREAFCEALERYVLFPDNLNAVQELHRFCGVLWKDSGRMKLNDRCIVRDAIADWVEADDWEAKGRTYAGAAQRLRPILKAAMGDAEAA